jgi:hypothetical protein
VQKTNETKKPRFKIEKLEERIAPAKGGIPGPPDGNGGGGGDNCHYVYHGGGGRGKYVGPGC